MKIADIPFTVVDIETTGARVEEDRIIEVGAVKIFGGKMVDTFHTLINPGRRIPFFISWITGINNRMVKDAPLFLSISEEFFHFIKGTVFVAHNAHFDYEFVKTELLRNTGPLLTNPSLCTIKLARRIYPGFTHYNLRDLSRNLGVSLERAHRALSDSMATAKILLLIFQKLSEFGLHDIQDLERMYQMSPQECREFLAKNLSKEWKRHSSELLQTM